MQAMVTTHYCLQTCPGHMTIFDSHHWLAPAAAFLDLSLAAIFSNFVVKALLLRLVDVVIENSLFGRDEVVRDTKIIHRLTKVIPDSSCPSGVPPFRICRTPLGAVVANVANAVVILVVAMTISAFLKLVDDLYHRRENAHLRPDQELSAGGQDRDLHRGRRSSWARPW